MHEIDWRLTPLGDPAGWSESLRSLLATLTRSRQPMLLLLGTELVQIYNDAYIEQGLSRHPAQMGQPTAATWPEVIGELSGQFADVLAHGIATVHENSMLRLLRNGQLVETYWTYGCTPFVDGRGSIRGVLVIPTETTQRVLAAQRQHLLQSLTDALAQASSPRLLPGLAADVLNAAMPGATVRFYRTPVSGFEPTLLTEAGPLAAAVDQDSSGVEWLRGDPQAWACLKQGQDVQRGEQMIAPLIGMRDAGFLHFIVVRADTQRADDDAHRQLLAQVIRRISQAADRLEASELRERAARERDQLLLQAPIATAVLTGPRLVFTLANQRYFEVVGRNDVIGKTYEEAFPELVGTELPGLLHHSYDTGTNYVSPETLIRLNRGPNGELEECYFRFNLQPMRTSTGDVYALIAMAVDLTEQVRARRAADAAHTVQRIQLEANAERLEEIVRARTVSLRELNEAMVRANAALKQAVDFISNVTEMVPGRIAYWDADRRCRFANRQFCDWVGREPEDVIGRSGEELFGAKRLATVEHHIQGALDGVPQRFETENLQADGERSYNQIDYVPEPSTGPEHRPGFYLMAIDITPSKEAKLTLEALNADLARSRDDAEAASRAKSAFLANMSHEIRTPLNAILGMTHILARSIVEREQKEQLQRVQTAAKHLLGLISDILDLSKIEAGKLVLEHNLFSVPDVMRWAMEMVRGTADSKGLSLSTDNAGLPPSVIGDSLRLSQILINLLSNAVKFTDRGTVALRGETTARRDGKIHLRFEVQDTGMGIPVSQQAGLFGSFEQADSSITRRHGGTGLGLSLSRQLARVMGGDAGVVSEAGVGSTFWFTVWLDESTGDAHDQASTSRLPAASQAEQLAAAEAMVRRLHAGRRVLLAEDNPVNQEVGVSLLEAVGLTVETAADGEVAIRSVRRGGFDLVLMDMQMPNVDGLEATKVIRAELFALPIIAMTANAFVDDRLACVDAGMDDHLPKPVEPLVLYSMLLKWLPASADAGRG